ncbi:ATP-dependent helicase [Clostridium sp. CX1]|uniref:DNA 3'-5' helicase n=1 Tax=Clostridium tanneri TaxID=3037988 RepID=A0ABU4JRY7_9CLOT|nr:MULTISPECIES: ATP-dependent helicase [unclassified Clostridium]MCT8977748.1 ATP-dependent helicase [Clostridium sp. CX1]MDW8800892.1 ATP-dependent helicase [Clostridium sp. A1-XYC3]
MAFRDDQIPIMEYTGGTMAVPAVPGAGKTFIVANLAARIIEERRHKPGKVLVVTYMNSAVNNFKSRISSVLKDKGITTTNDYEVMTIHSLAMKILRDRPDVVGVNEEFGILDDVRKVFYLNEAIEEWRKNNGERIFKSLLTDKAATNYRDKGQDWWKDFFSIADCLISELKLNDISPEKLRKYLEFLSHNSIIRHIYEIYRLYTKRLKTEGYLDYNDLLVLAYKALLRDEKLRDKFQSRYTFIFEDECQDSNLVQCKILALISENSGNLVRVGDLNQSIMGTFTSSDPRFFADFCKDAEEKHVMNMAGRSSKEIIDLANFLVEYARSNHPVQRCREALAEQKLRLVTGLEDFKNPQLEEYGIQAYYLDSWDEVKKDTIKKIIDFKSRCPEKTIGVLVPYNNHVTEIAGDLRRLNIECDELSNTAEKRIRVTKVLGNMLRFLGEPDNIHKFMSLIDVLIDDNSEEKEEILEFISKNKVDSLVRSDINLENTKVSRHLSEKIKEINKVLSVSQSSIDNLILHISTSLNLSTEDKAMAQAVASFVKYEIKENPSLTLEEISEQLLDNKKSVFKHMSDIIYDLQGYEPVPGRVTVATCHKSKGLEWDCVFLLCLTEYNFPALLNARFRSDYYYFKKEYTNPVALGKSEIQKLLGERGYDNPFLEAKIDVLNEKIRLLYVAITRAREYLYLVAHNGNQRFNPDKPSKYFEVLQKFIEGERTRKG